MLWLQFPWSLIILRISESSDITKLSLTLDIIDLLFSTGFFLLLFAYVLPKEILTFKMDYMSDAVALEWTFPPFSLIICAYCRLVTPHKWKKEWLNGWLDGGVTNRITNRWLDRKDMHSLTSSLLCHLIHSFSDNKYPSYIGYGNNHCICNNIICSLLFLLLFILYSRLLYSSYLCSQWSYLSQRIILLSSIISWFYILLSVLLSLNIGYYYNISSNL